MVEFVPHDKTPGLPSPAPARDELDYGATARRPGFGALPAAVRRTITGWAGGRIDAVQLAGGGFTHGFAALIEGPRPVFVKAIALDDPYIAPAYAREVEVLAALPDGLAVPALLEHAVVDGWRIFATAPVPGRMPGSPWTLADARAVHDAARLANTVLTPVAPQALGIRGTLAGDWVDLLDELDGGNAVLAAGLRPGFLPAGFRGPDGDPLAQWIRGAAARAPTALVGTTPLNNDLRADNVIIARDAVGGFAAGTAWICDWNYLTLGPEWADWVVQWPALHDDGLPLDQIAGWELTAGVPNTDLDAWLAAILIYYTAAGARAPLDTSPDLRRHQQLCARQAWGLVEFRASRGRGAGGWPGRVLEPDV